MSQVPEFESATFPTIEAACVGGSPTPVPLIETWAAKGLPLQQAYGMTETSPLVLALKPEDCTVKIGSAGLPAMHTEVRIVDDDGNDVEPRARPASCGSGGQTSPPATGTARRPTADSFTDGFLHTGDAVPPGRGRLLLRGGPVEGHVHLRRRERLPGRSRVCHLRAARRWARWPSSASRTRSGSKSVGPSWWSRKARALRSLTVINHCREKLARYKVPQSVVFIDEIPHNATGKVLKRELRDAHGRP